MSELGKYSTSFTQREALPNIKRHIPYHYYDVTRSVISKSGEISQTAKYEETSTMVGYATPVADGADRYFFSFEILVSHPPKESVADPILSEVGEKLILTAQLPSGDFYASLGSNKDVGLNKIDFKNWRQFDKGTPKAEILKTLKKRGGEPQAEQKADLGKINFEFI